MRRACSLLAGAAFLLVSAIGPLHAESEWRLFQRADGLAADHCRFVSVSAQNEIVVTHGSSSLVSQLNGYSIATVDGPDLPHGRIYESPGGQLWSMATNGLLERREEHWVFHGLKEAGLEGSAAGGAWLVSAPLVPIRQGRVLVLLPDRLIAFTSDAQSRSRYEVLRESRQTKLGKFSGMVRSRDGGLWISGAAGLAKVPGPLRNLSPDTHWEAYIPDSSVDASGFTNPHEDSGGGVTMLGSAKDGSQLFAAFSGQKWSTMKAGSEKLTEAWRASDGSLWALAGDVLLRWDQSRSEFLDYGPGPRRCFDLATGESGDFWIAAAEGLYHYAGSLWEPWNWTGTAIHGLAAEPRGGVWVLASNALHLLDENKDGAFPLPESLVDTKTSQRILPLENGIVVLGSERGLYQLNPATGEFKPVTGMTGQARTLGMVNGSLLIATKEEGGGAAETLKLYNGTTFTPFAAVPLGSSVGNFLSVFASARNADLWFGAEHGTALLHEGKWQWFGSSENSAPASPLAMAETIDGTLWCATGDRVWKFDGKQWLDFRRGFDRISAMIAAHDGSLWVGSHFGVFRFFRGAWVQQGSEEGVPDETIIGLCEDKAERLWAAAAKALASYHPEMDSEPPRSTAQLLATKKIHEGEDVKVAFSGTDKWNSTPSARLLFSWRLDAKPWSEFEEARLVTLKELPAGKHVFQVRALDRNSNLEPNPAELNFAVIVPWYREARLVLILGFGVAMVLFFAGLAFNRHLQLRRSYAEIERKIAQRTLELERANQELLHSQKMNALGTLAAGIAHDFNNILSIIEGSAQLIEENLDNPQKVRTRLSRIKTVVEQGSGIVKAMLGFTRESGPVEACEINLVINDTLKLLGDRFLREVRISFNPVDSVPAVLGSRDFIQQILLNLIFNAAEAMANAKAIHITARPCDAFPALPVLFPAKASGYVCVSVKDTGSGIPPEILPRIFEPFFTTKALSTKRGTGLGLSMVYELAKKLGAGIVVESMINQGSTFTIILPVGPVHPEPQSPGLPERLPARQDSLQPVSPE